VDRIERFEDIRAWQAARELNRRIYEITRRNDFARDRGLAIQIQRASVSIMSNIAEGFERGSLTEFRQYLSISKGSCAEVRSLLYAAKDVGYIDQPTFDTVMASAQAAGRLIGALRKSIDVKVRSINEEVPSYRIEPLGPELLTVRESRIQSEDSATWRYLDEADDQHE
jgi:four helix bundle protein